MILKSFMAVLLLLSVLGRNALNGVAYWREIVPSVTLIAIVEVFSILSRRFRFLEDMTYRPAGAQSLSLGQSIDIPLLRSGKSEPISYRLLSPVRDEMFIASPKKESLSSVRSDISSALFVIDQPTWKESMQQP
jgi:hypothetical protein